MYTEESVSLATCESPVTTIDLTSSLARIEPVVLLLTRRFQMLPIFLETC